MTSGQRMMGTAVAAALWTSFASAAAPAGHAGELCIAAFEVREVGGPVMDNVPGPGRDSKYSFRFDQARDVAVGLGEARLVEGLPADRRFLVEVRLDDRRTEAFWVDLREEQPPRTCLWLRQGYWHWAPTYWADRSRGCKCWPRPTD